MFSQSPPLLPPILRGSPVIVIIPSSTTSTTSNADSNGMYKVTSESDFAKKKKLTHTKSEDVEKQQEREERERQQMIEEREEKERIRLEKKKRTQEDMVADFVKILENMMNPRQAVTSLMSALAGILSLIVGVIYIFQLPEHSFRANELAWTLIVYGILQLLLATTYFVTCMQTSIAVTKGVKDTSQIVIGVLVAGAYVVIAFVSLFVGLFGFYKTLCMCSSVEYKDINSPMYCPQVQFVTCLIVFIFHLITIVLKCCCCK